jgi:hypothetical protein
MSFRPVEVGEAVRPGRRRVDEYRAAKQKPSDSNSLGHLIDPICTPFITLERVVRKKCKKPYPIGSWLIVNYNISFGYVSQYGWWHDHVLSTARAWPLSNKVFQRILVLNSSRQAIVELYPEMKVIVPEK